MPFAIAVASIGVQRAFSTEQGVASSAIEGSNPINNPKQADLQMLKDRAGKQPTSFADGWFKDGARSVTGSSGDGKRRSDHGSDDDALVPGKKHRIVSKPPGTRQSFIRR